MMLTARKAKLLELARAETASKGAKAAWLSLDLRKPEAPALLVQNRYLHGALIDLDSGTTTTM